MKAKNFSLPDQDGKLHKLSDYKGKWLLLYFYPKDDTPGCTKEACSFRDLVSEFQKRKVEIVGISKDSISSHKKFADKYKLNFALLSDTDHKIIQAYGAWGIKKFMGREFEGTKRNSYLIDKNGAVVKEYLGVNPLMHAREILEDINDLNKGGDNYEV